LEFLNKDYISLAHEANNAAIKIRVTSRSKGVMYKISKRVQKYIELSLKKGISPEAISGRLKYKWKIQVSYETIYQWIFKERHDLYSCLLRAGKHRRRRMPKKYRRKLKQPAPQKTSIEVRPVVVAERSRIGDIEHDSIVSKQSNAAIQTVVDRATRKVFLQKLEDQCADTYSLALIDRMRNAYPQATLNTATNDNGKENANHKIIDESLNIQTFFCHPYCSSERGTVEHMNGVIRRFIPKGTDIANVTEAQLRLIEDFINNRPMKCLGFMTPNEKWKELLLKHALEFEKLAA
jgi:IS30 family transposase